MKDRDTAAAVRSFITSVDFMDCPLKYFHLSSVDFKQPKHAGMPLAMHKKL